MPVIDAEEIRRDCACSLGGAVIECKLVLFHCTKDSDPIKRQKNYSR